MFWIKKVPNLETLSHNITRKVVEISAAADSHFSDDTEFSMMPSFKDYSDQ